MPADDRGATPPPAKPEENCPPLALVTGALDPVWQSLELGHPAYDQFWWVWQVQEDWSHWDFAAYWMGHLRHWPRTPGRPSSVGLKAARAAAWLRQGYSRAQIERALGYTPNATPKRLWSLAQDYADWLGRVSPGRLPDPGGVAILEGLYAAGVDPSTPGPGGGRIVTQPPVAADAEGARQWVRRRLRSPRVVTLAEWEAEPFGCPEPWSARLLYSNAELALIDRAAARVANEAPFHEALAA